MSGKRKVLVDEVDDFHFFQLDGPAGANASSESHQATASDLPGDQASVETPEVIYTVSKQGRLLVPTRIDI